MDLVFADEESPPLGSAKSLPKKPWCILLVDDDAEVHAVTRLALNGFEFQGSALELLSAHSGQEGRDIFNARDDIALAIVDVVMESDRWPGFGPLCSQYLGEPPYPPRHANRSTRAGPRR